MQFDYEISLDIFQRNYVEIESRQYDDLSRKIKILVTKEGEPITIPSGTEFRCEVKKPDGTYVKTGCTAVPESGKTYIIMTLTLNMLAAHGVELIDIVMEHSGQVLGTMSFINRILPAAVQDDDIMSTSEARELVEAMEEAEDLREDIQSADGRLVNLETGLDDLLSALINQFKTSPVVFNVQNRYVDKSGGYTTNSDWQTAGFIPIEGNTVYFKGHFSNLGNAGWNVALYDEQQTFISGRGYLLGTEAENGVIIDATGASYLRVSNVKNYTIEMGFLNSDIIANTFNILSEQLNIAFSESGYIKTDGTLNSTASDWVTTPFISINHKAMIVRGSFYNVGESNGFNICLYDNKQQMLCGQVMTVNSAYVNIADASYVRFSTHEPYLNISATAIFPKDVEKNTEIIVDKNGNGDFTSLLRALKSTDSSFSIRVRSGEYDLIEEYQDYYGQSFFDNYNGYSGTTDPFYRGLWLDNGRKIYCDSGTVIKCVYEGTNNKVATLFSAIANGGNTVLENVTIKHGNLRYAIHDDFGPISSTITWKNIRFVGHSNGSVIGGGLGLNSTYIIDGCVFEGNRQPWDINYHGSNSANAENVNKIYVTNCKGNRGCGFWPNGSATTLSTAFVSNSKFGNIQVYRPDGQSETQTMNVELIEWNNTVD